jgi:serine/threonine protein kinase
MEFLEGQSLDGFVARFGRQPEGRVIHFLRQICGSLAEAHGVGLIHRDIKPANIMLTTRGGLYDFVKVLDFGLVRAVDAQRDVAITSANTVSGTPQYLSPEGIERPDEVDARGDLYAVAAVGYFLLTGTPVFTGKTPMEVCLQQVRETPQRPSERRGEPVSADLEDLLLRCLAKRPEDRPASAAELLAALSACASAGSWSTEQAADWWRDAASAGAPLPGSSPTVHLQQTMAWQST